MTKEEMIRRYFSGWENQDWNAIAALLAPDFTFTSPNDDDHIDQRAFKQKCWPADWIARFELEAIAECGNNAFVKYLYRIKDGRWIRNTEYFMFADEKIQAIEVYFGEGSVSFAASINSRQEAKADH